MTAIRRATSRARAPGSWSSRAAEMRRLVALASSAGRARGVAAAPALRRRGGRGRPGAVAPRAAAGGGRSLRAAARAALRPRGAEELQHRGPGVPRLHSRRRARPRRHRRPHRRRHQPVRRRVDGGAGAGAARSQRRPLVLRHGGLPAVRARPAHHRRIDGEPHRARHRAARAPARELPVRRRCTSRIRRTTRCRRRRCSRASLRPTSARCRRTSASASGRRPSPPPWPRTAPPASRRSCSSPTRARPTPAPSTTSRPAPTSPARTGCGCTSMPPTAGSSSSPSAGGARCAASSARTRSRSTRTRACSCPTAPAPCSCATAQALRRAHGVHADYLPAVPEDPDFVDFSTVSPELSRDFRGLRVWLPIKMHGIGAFRRALDEKLDLAAWAALGAADDPGRRDRGRAPALAAGLPRGEAGAGTRRSRRSQPPGDGGGERAAPRLPHEHDRTGPLPDPHLRAVLPHAHGPDADGARGHPRRDRGDEDSGRSRPVRTRAPPSAIQAPTNSGPSRVSRALVPGSGTGRDRHSRPYRASRS